MELKGAIAFCVLRPLAGGIQATSIDARGVAFDLRACVANQA
jgi:hypothetical protein